MLGNQNTIKIAILEGKYRQQNIAAWLLYVILFCQNQASFFLLYE
jgi:hypothetical protein